MTKNNRCVFIYNWHGPMIRRVNICRPGCGASCALCCGSHNYRASRGEIEMLFRRRTAFLQDYTPDFLVKKMIASRSRMTGSYYIDQLNPLFDRVLAPLYEDCPSCPFVGFLADEKTVGCLLRGDEAPSGLHHECFLSYRGKVFSCSARGNIGDEETLYAARLFRDWYYYSIIIHEPELLRSLMRESPVPDDVTAAQRERYEMKLEGRITACRELHGMHGYFS